MEVKVSIAAAADVASGALLLLLPEHKGLRPVKQGGASSVTVSHQTHVGDELNRPELEFFYCGATLTL